MSDKQSHPLSWPDNWPRTAPGRREPSRFTRGICDGQRYGGRCHSMAESTEFLANELARLGARSEVLSTNLRQRLDGKPYSNQAQPSDPGAAVYFSLKGKPVSLACDKWLRVEDNVWAIAKHIEALRGQERWGVGSIEQAFRGYMALPSIGESSGIKWWEVLGVPINASPEQVKEAFRVLAHKHHPDKGGERDLWDRLREAWDLFNSQSNHKEEPNART